MNKVFGYKDLNLWNLCIARHFSEEKKIIYI